MSFSPSFTISRTSLNDAIVIATDTSTGSDVLIVGKHITLTDSNDNTLVVSGTTTSYNLWPTVTNPISLNLLSTDTAVTILVEWVNVAGVALYSSEEEFCLANYSKTFLYYLGQSQSLTPGIVQDQNYNSNMATFWATLRGAINMVEEADDVSGSQNLLNICNNMRNNQSLYF